MQFSMVSCDLLTIIPISIKQSFLNLFIIKFKTLSKVVVYHTVKFLYTLNDFIFSRPNCWFFLWKINETLNENIQLTAVYTAFKVSTIFTILQILNLTWIPVFGKSVKTFKLKNKCISFILYLNFWDYGKINISNRFRFLRINLQKITF